MRLLLLICWVSGFSFAAPGAMVHRVDGEGGGQSRPTKENIGKSVWPETTSARYFIENFVPRIQGRNLRKAVAYSRVVALRKELGPFKEKLESLKNESTLEGKQKLAAEWVGNLKERREVLNKARISLAIELRKKEWALREETNPRAVDVERIKELKKDLKQATTNLETFDKNYPLEDFTVEKLSAQIDERLVALSETLKVLEKLEKELDTALTESVRPGRTRIKLH